VACFRVPALPGLIAPRVAARAWVRCLTDADPAAVNLATKDR
jgi:hypothetical protein